MPLVGRPPSDWRDRVPRTPPWDGVLLCRPDHFDVVDVKNAFMAGQVGRIDRVRALDQWEALAATYRRVGVAVHVLDGADGLEDMVFCANPVCVLPREGGGADVVASRMNHASRRREVPHVVRWFETHGLPATSLGDDVGTIEGHGDVLVVPGRRLALGGHGGRTTRGALEALAEATGVTLVPLALVGEPFYHLDTCLAVLDEDTVLVHPPAFRGDALDVLRALFPRVLVADPAEAREHLAVNAHGLADGHVVLPAQAVRTAETLAAAGLRPLPVDVSEFHRSGGSVFCMRLDLPTRPA